MRVLCRVYQLPISNKKIFMSFSRIDSIKLSDYCCVWSEDLDDLIKLDINNTHKTMCEKLYEKFNLHLPKGFGGHSMSVSDIIEFMDYENNRLLFYFCDSSGFIELEQIDHSALVFEGGKL